MQSQSDDCRLFEVHYLPFEAASKAKVASVVCSYNELNRPHAFMNSELLQSHLKDFMSFEGW